ncbi:hypothetical protein V2K50_22965 [Pseudomonas alliivorans]|uniref:Uncharacterized protein n=1 Tax=Pseudomonas alliivorans TaxID=2810613 RepID=A0ABS4C0K1_9PSED|nr:hypothetical protein [Pseudomonas alliivorans]MBP0943846.1 hypothetical protein [Pseudomonas alliivorans]MEE4325864.1 hypothetical protein [Pseudomonas alliivorans]MEE4367394.1 hypothetical protein [Pseudomonas alliivorans]MEE5122715.1 hypothetical protein [Pseudomonas alliivorans]
MLKIKYLRINLPEELEISYNKLLGFPFERDGQAGFEGISFSSEHVDLKFIERIITKEKITDPFGNTQELISTRYIVTELSIISSNKVYILVIRNPSRSVNTLIKKMSSVIGQNFYAAAINTDIKNFGNYLATNHSTLGLTSTKVLASNLVLDSHSTANVELISGINALDDLQKHFPLHNTHIERARFTLTDHGKRSQLEIKHTGTIGISGHKHELLEEIITDYVCGIHITTS